MDENPDIKRLPIAQAILYSFGYFGVQLIGFSIGQIPQIYYVPENGAAMIAPATIGGALLAGGYIFGFMSALGRIVDGVTDPWIGNMSDHLRSRFGRRKPFLVIGAPLAGLFLVLFTTPPSHEPSHLNILWLAFVYPLFFIFFTAAITPYLAILPEITRHPKDRLLVTSLQSAFMILGMFTSVAIVQLIPEKLPFTLAATIIAVTSTLPFLLVAAFVKIPDDRSVTPRSEKRPSTFSQVKSVLGFRLFSVYLASIVVFWFGFNMVEISARYVATHLIGSKDSYIIILGLALGMAALLAPLSYFLGRKLGKRRSMILMSVLFIILLPCIGFIGKGPFSNHYVSYAIFGLLGIPLSLLLVIPNSLLSDIIDRNNEETGERREALFFASQALINKIGIAISNSTLNFILPIGAVVTAMEAHAVGEAGVRLIGPAAAIFVLIGLLIFLKFPEIEKKAT